MESQLSEGAITIDEILNAEIEFESDDKCTSCVGDIKNSEQEITLIQRECKELRRKYHDMLIDNLKKDVEIEDLEMQQVREQSKYTEYTNNFTQKSMETLRSIGNTKADDGKFILAAVIGLYEDRLEILKERNISGRSKSKTKQPMTIEKMKILQGLFTERIQNSTEFPVRNKNVKTLIKTAIETINKKHK